MNAFYVANSLSLIAAVFLILGSAVKSRTCIYLFQCLESLFLLLARLAFGQGAAAVLLVSLARNILLLKRSYNAPAMVSVFVLTVALGVRFNGGGLVGLIPVLAGAAYAVAIYRARSFFAVKLSLLLNIALWALYSALIGDIATCLVNLLSVVINLASLVAFCISRRSSSRGADR